MGQASLRRTLVLDDQEVVLVRNKGANAWMLNAWKVSPGANVLANDSTEATQATADSSDGALGAGDARSLQTGLRSPGHDVGNQLVVGELVDGLAAHRLGLAAGADCVG